MTKKTLGGTAYDVKLLRALASEEKKRVVLLLLKKGYEGSASDVAYEIKTRAGIASYTLEVLVEAGVVVSRHKNGKLIKYYQISKTVASRLLALAKLFEGAL